MNSIFTLTSNLDTWTITTFFGVLLANAEVLYGPRVTEHTILGNQIDLTDRPALCSFDGNNSWFISTRRGLEGKFSGSAFRCRA